jgi:hypothetical protein
MLLLLSSGAHYLHSDLLRRTSVNADADWALHWRSARHIGSVPPTAAPALSFGTTEPFEVGKKRCLCKRKTRKEITKQAFSSLTGQQASR